MQHKNFNPRAEKKEETKCLYLPVLNNTNTRAHSLQNVTGNCDNIFTRLEINLMGTEERNVMWSVEMYEESKTSAVNKSRRMRKFLEAIVNSQNVEWSTRKHRGRKNDRLTNQEWRNDLAEFCESNVR